MPRIPTLGPQVASSGTYSAPRTVPQESAFGPQAQALGQAAMSAGKALGSVAYHLQNELDTAETKHAYNLWAEEARNTENGYKQVLGRAAQGDAKKRALKTLDEKRQSIAKGLGNDTQRTMFGEVVDRQMLSVRQELDAHEIKQVQAYNLAESQTMLASASADAAAALAREYGRQGPPEVQGPPEPGQPPRMAPVTGTTMKNTAVAQAHDIADQLGWPQDSAQRQALVQETTSNIHAQVLDQMIAQERPDSAKGYLAAHGDEMTTETRTKATKLVQTATVQDESTRLAMLIERQVLQQSRDRRGALNQSEPMTEQEIANYLPNAKVLLDEQFANGAITADVRDATFNRIKSDVAVARDANAGQSQAVLGEAQAWLAQNPLAAVTDMPATLYNEVARRGLLDSVHNFADGRRYTTDPSAMAEVLDAPKSYFKSMSAKEFFVKYRGRLSDPDLRVAQAFHSAANERASAEDNQLLDKTQRLRLGASKSPLQIPAAGTLSDSDAEKFVWYVADVERRLQSIAGDEKYTPEQLQQAMDEFALDMADVPGFLWGYSPQPVGTATDEERSRMSIETPGGRIPLRQPGGTGTISAEERGKIIETLIRRGLPVTEDSIMKLWVLAGRPGEPVNTARDIEALRGQVLPAGGVSLDQPAAPRARVEPPYMGWWRGGR